MMGASKDLLVIMRAGTATHGIRTFGPAGTTIFGPPDSTFPAIEFDCGINHVRVLL